MRIPLARLIPAAACLATFTAACSGSAPVDGIVHGHLYGVGGPAPGAPRAWPGMVTVSGPGVHRDVPAGRDGAYSITLPAGSYTIVGHSHSYQDGAGLCRAAGVAKVRGGHSTTADVVCQMK